MSRTIVGGQMSGNILVENFHPENILGITDSQIGGTSPDMSHITSQYSTVVLQTTILEDLKGAPQKC